MGRAVLGRGIGILALVALVAAFVLARTDASHALGGLPQCSDFVDNDGDGEVDYPADSDCSGLLDTSESSGGASSCGPLPCVTFLTDYKPPSGPDVICQHGVPAFVTTPIDNVLATQIDVTDPSCHGTADVGVAVRVPTNLDTNKPSIKVIKEPGAPSTLPLRIEAVQVDGSDPSKRQTVGYDTLDSTAPQSFKVALDLSQGQDGDPQTDDVHADITTSGAGSSLAFVSDSFTPGSSLNDRQHNHRNRLEFSNPVPSSISLDVNTSDDHQHLHLTRDVASTLDFLVSQPNSDPLVSGELNQMPPTMDVNLNDVDSDGNGTLDEKRIVYDADAPVSHATVHVETVRDANNGPHRLKADASINDLPGHAAFTYDGDNNFDYSANGNASFARITLNDEKPIFSRARYVDAQLTDVPPHLHARFKSDHIDFSACQFSINVSIRGPICRKFNDLGYLHVRALPQAPTGLEFCTIPCEDHLDLTDIPSTYDLNLGISRLKSATVDLEPKLDVQMNTAPELVDSNPCGKRKAKDIICKRRRDLVPVWRTPFNVYVQSPKNAQNPGAGNTTISGRVSAIQPATRFTFDHAHGTHITYSDHGSGAGSGPDIRLDGSNMAGLPTGENGVQDSAIHVALQNMPRVLSFDGAEGGFPIKVDASAPADPNHGVDNILDKAEVQLTNGPDEHLPETECIDVGSTPCAIYRELDGVEVRDTPSEYVIFVRLHGVRHVDVNKFTGADKSSHLTADMNANAFDDHERALRVDMQKRVSVKPGGGSPVFGTQTTKATLDKLPQHAQLSAVTAGDDTHVNYDANETVDHFEYSDETDWDNNAYTGGSSQHVSADPMPAHLEICKVGNGPECAQHRFDDHLQRVHDNPGPIGGINVSPDEANQGSVRLIAEPSTDFHYDADPNFRNPNDFGVVDLTVNHFWLQAQQHEWDCDFGAVTCKRGYLGIDTGWDGTSSPPNGVDPGVIRLVEGPEAINEFHFPDTWASEAHVFAFEKTGAVSGKVIGVGRVNCPSGTYLHAGSDEITDRFCKSHLTESGFKH
jgi:hypothetical protein